METTQPIKIGLPGEHAPGNHHCAFCGKTRQVVKMLVAGPASVMICDECVDLSMTLLIEKGHLPPPGPIPLILTCPICRARHIDEGEFATKVHHTHACQGCGHVWRPAVVPTVGVRFLPGFKNPEVTT